MGSQLGNLKTSAKRVGLSVAEYRERVEAGLKRCTRCKAWKQRDCFGIDRSRADGLKAACIDCSRVAVKKTRKLSAPSERVQNGATEAVRQAVKRGRLAPASSLPCADCGKPATEYHHHLGYARSHWLDVVALCRSCHLRRHWDES